MKNDVILYQNVLIPRTMVAKTPIIAEIIIVPVPGSRYAFEKIEPEFVSDRCNLLSTDKSNNRLNAILSFKFSLFFFMITPFKIKVLKNNTLLTIAKCIS